MTTPVLLLLLRIISAVLLLAFFAAVGWYLRQDLRATRRAMSGQGPVSYTHLTLPTNREV